MRVVPTYDGRTRRTKPDPEIAPVTIKSTNLRSTLRRSKTPSTRIVIGSTDPWPHCILLRSCFQVEFQQKCTGDNGYGNIGTSCPDPVRPIRPNDSWRWGPRLKEHPKILKTKLHTNVQRYGPLCFTSLILFCSHPWSHMRMWTFPLAAATCLATFACAVVVSCLADLHLHLLTLLSLLLYFVSFSPLAHAKSSCYERGECDAVVSCVCDAHVISSHKSLSSLLFAVSAPIRLINIYFLWGWTTIKEESELRALLGHISWFMFCVVASFSLTLTYPPTCFDSISKRIPHQATSL